MCPHGSIQTMGFEMIGLSRVCQEVTYQNSTPESSISIVFSGINHPFGHPHTFKPPIVEHGCELALETQRMWRSEMSRDEFFTVGF